MGPLDKYILTDDALEATPDGFALRFQSHWYRSLPLSCMDFRLKIDGQAVDQANVTVEANGKTFRYADLLDLTTEYLFILDRARIQGALDKPLQAGKAYQVEFNLDLYIPYILVGPESKPLLAGSQVAETLTCQPV